MKVYLGIITILVVVFIQSGKNYHNSPEFYSFRSTDSSILSDKNAGQKFGKMKPVNTVTRIRQNLKN